jgi:uncharacterized caspase-like protein/predicted metal-dependent hydrolase
MTHWLRIFALLILALCLTPAFGAPEYPADEPRVALLIGNGAYASDPLHNAVRDTRALAAILTATGFSVTKLEDAGYREMLDALRNFGQKMQRQRGAALFYFSGHGLQMEGENYLMPVDSDIRRAHEIKYSALHVAQVLDEMEYANNRINIVVLDASRNSSFAGEYRSVSRGLAQVKAPGGTMIALATAPGNVSTDAKEHSSLYTKQLIANLSVPGLPIEQVFKRVRADVMHESDGAQVPWENSSLVGDFYFTLPANGVVSASPPSMHLPNPVSQPAAAAPASSQASELAHWNSIKHSEKPDDYATYLQTYPEGQFQALARFRLRKYQRQSSRASNTAPPPKAVAASGFGAAKPQAAVTNAPPTFNTSTASQAALALTLAQPKPYSPPMPAFSFPTPEEELLAKAQNAFKANRLTTPINDSAVKWSKEVLALNPNNTQAQQMIQQVVDKYVGWSSSNLRREKFAKAQRYLEKAERLKSHASLTQQTRMQQLSEKIDQALAFDVTPDESATTAAVAPTIEPEQTIEASNDEPKSFFEAISEDLSKFNLDNIQQDMQEQHENSGFQINDYD